MKNQKYKKEVRKGLRCEIPEYDGTSPENMAKVYGVRNIIFMTEKNTLFIDLQRKFVIKIMNACWHKDPEKRPTFATLRVIYQFSC